MSENSYRVNVRRKVTGKYHNTCWPSSAERISPNHRLPGSVYTAYKRFVGKYNSLSAMERGLNLENNIALVERIIRPLGVLSCDDLVFKHAVTVRQLDSSLRWLLANEHRPIVDLDIDGVGHSIGILPGSEAGRYYGVSNWKPRALNGEFTGRQLFDWLRQPLPEDTVVHPDVLYHPLNCSFNIIALPPPEDS